MKWMKDMVVEGQYHHIVGARDSRSSLRVILGEAGQGLHLLLLAPQVGGRRRRRDPSPEDRSSQYRRGRTFTVAITVAITLALTILSVTS